ncbi:helix-turn-helix domain-containing protein [Oenococcus sicerae]|uniref:XRE family transcriptional regulator n=1 Tax=Oenococcus sicerae TaxID=2203724 RepID=A0AAJ1R7P8_9LACO|nr:helix-turn-helix transcriptional regulator [Oenococcus sicerae]MDN6899654.1 XRE family transcriptional regulator [Oenococcus sicerae]
MKKDLQLMHMIDKDIFRKNFAQAIDESGLSQREIARRLKLSPSTITGWLHGRTEVSTDSILEIATVLHKDPSWFFISNSNKETAIHNLSDNQLALAMSADPDITDEQLQQAINYVRFIKQQEDDKYDSD